MNRGKKLSIALVAGICSLLIVLSATVLVSPWFFNNTRVGNKICGEVSRLINGEFRYDEIRLSLFPSPHIVLVTPLIHIPNTLSVSVETIELYPELIKLFTGRLGLKKTVINRPSATIWIPEADTKKKADAVETNQMVLNLLKSLSGLPKLFLAFEDGRISNGNVTLITHHTATVKLESIDAVLQNFSETLSFKITSSSNMFDTLSMKGAIQTNTLNGHAHIELRKLKLEDLYNDFLPEASLKMVDGDADIGIGLDFQNNDTLDVTLKGSVPSVTVVQENRTVEIEGPSVDARININPTSTTITLSDLQLGNPSMQVSGNFCIFEQSPRLNMQLEVRNIDIDSTRSVSLALAGSSNVTETIFGIVKDGSIPLVTLTSSADTTSGLTDVDNLVLQASLTNGTIDVPGTNMALTGVSGDVGMKKGVLTGEHLSAQRQKSTVKNGVLTIDLTKDPLPLDIKTDVTIDVADIPGILQNVVRDKTLDDELKKIENLKGSARAVLSITGSTNQIKVNVSASDVELAVLYKQFPFLLRIDSGEVAYEGTQIRWKQFKGSVGSSSFTSFAGNLDLGGNKNLEITSGSSDVLVSEFLPWIALELNKPEIINYYVGGKSILHLSQVEMGGPLKDFHEWHYKIAGEFEDLKLFANVSVKTNEVILKKLTIKDEISQASIRGQYLKPILTVNFDGQFNTSTLGRFLQLSKKPSTGVIEGQAQIHLNLKNTHDVSFIGKINGKNISIPASSKAPLLVRNILLKGTPETVSIEAAELSWNNTAMNLSGTITPNGPEKPAIALDVEVDSVDVEKILTNIGSKPRGGDKKAKPFSSPVVGTVRFRANKVETKDVTIQPLQAEIQLQAKEAKIAIKKMGLCDVMASGTAKITPHNFDYTIQPTAKKQQLNATLNCFTDKHFKADGMLELNGSFAGHGTMDELPLSSIGSMDLKITDGHIYRDIILLNVLKFLNAAQVVTGRVSPGQMRKKGLAFSRFEAQIELEKGKLKYQKVIFDGDAIQLSGVGEIDLLTKKINFTMLVTTQKTANTLLGHIPVIGDVLQTIATIPLTVKGNIDDVKILPLAPSAVGYELIEVTKNTLGIPVHLIHLKDFHEKAKHNKM